VVVYEKPLGELGRILMTTLRTIPYALFYPGGDRVSVIILSLV
jgi:hypothetical protein